MIVPKKNLTSAKAIRIGFISSTGGGRYFVIIHRDLKYIFVIVTSILMNKLLTSFTKHALFASMLFLSCQSQKQSVYQVETQHFLVLLKDGLNFSDVAFFSPYEIKMSKRVSRSQNLWMIHLELQKDQIDLFLTEGKEAEGITMISQPSKKETKPYTNTKKGKSKPTN